ncbi:quinolone resistance protein, partial [Pseudomonas sp. 2588-5]
QLDSSNFAETSLDGIDFTTCEFDNITISFDKLAGCIVTSEQAIGFSKAFGIVISDE